MIVTYEEVAGQT